MGNRGTDDVGLSNELILDMKCVIMLIALSLVCASSPRLVEVAKQVNSMHTTWEANEAMPARDYSQLLGALKGGVEAPIKKVQIRGELPTEFDPAKQWPECPSLKEIRDQSTCGSCWAFGAVEAATDRLCIATKGANQDRLSEQDLLSCCDSCGFGCEGGFPTTAWHWFLTKGVTTGDEHGSSKWCKAYSFPRCEHHGCTGPYPECGETQPTPECVEKCREGYPKTYEEDKHFFYELYSVGDKVEAIKTELMTNGPMEVAFDVYEDFMTYKSGIYQHVTGEKVGGHAVKLLGWGVENGVEYWKIANSWNETWGEEGYFRIIMGKDECGIESSNVAGLPMLNWLVSWKRKSG